MRDVCVEQKHFKTCLVFYVFVNRVEKRLRHVAVVAKFLNDNKLRTSLKKGIRTISNLIDVIEFHLSCQMLVKFSEVESERIVSKCRKRRRAFLCCVHLLHKAGKRN